MVQDSGMKITNKQDTIRFTVKGQVVISIRLRMKFKIEEGTRALVTEEGDAIVLKPIMPWHIRDLRGSLKGSGVVKVDDGRPEARAGTLMWPLKSWKTGGCSPISKANPRPNRSNNFCSRLKPV